MAQGQGAEDGETTEDGKPAGNSNTEEGKNCPGPGMVDSEEDDVVEVESGKEESGSVPDQDINKGEPSKA